MNLMLQCNIFCKIEMSQKSQISGFDDSQQLESETDDGDEFNDNDLSQIQSSSSKDASIVS